MFPMISSVLVLLGSVGYFCSMYLLLATSELPSTSVIILPLCYAEMVDTALLYGFNE